jgi:thymidine kinase
MYRHPISGHIEVVCGSMFSGKTEELLRRIRRAQIGKQKVQVFKPGVDNRYSLDHVQSHDATKTASITVKSAKDILEKIHDNTRVVGIDEAQFFDTGILEVIQKLAYRGMRVIVAGLDTDFMGQPFGPMPALLAMAEDVTKLYAVCVVCGAPATRSQRIVRNAEPSEQKQILVGAHDSYEARCRVCHEPRALPSHESTLAPHYLRPKAEMSL